VTYAGDAGAPDSAAPDAAATPDADPEGAIRESGGTRKAAIALIGTSVVGCLVFVVVSWHRQLTPLEEVFIQEFFLVVGLVGSYLLARASIRAAAIEMLRPYARSTLRRLTWLFYSLHRLADEIERSRSLGRPDPQEGESSPDEISPYDTLRVSVVGQLATTIDAIEDWRDLVPEDVAAVEHRAGETAKELVRKRRE
jgi:hypothetical protein